MTNSNWKAVKCHKCGEMMKQDNKSGCCSACRRAPCRTPGCKGTALDTYRHPYCPECRQKRYGSRTLKHPWQINGTVL